MLLLKLLILSKSSNVFDLMKAEKYHITTLINNAVLEIMIRLNLKI